MAGGLPTISHKPMAILILENLPPRCEKSDILAFVARAGDLERRKIGRIEVSGRTASVEVPDGLDAHLLKATDGARLKNRNIRASVRGGRRDSAATSKDDDHFERLTRLLDLESKAEARQTAERLSRMSPADAEKTGASLVDLTLEEESSGMGGRFLLRFRKRRHDALLPWTRLSIGAPVLVTASWDGQSQTARGIVANRDERRIVVAMDETPDAPDEEVSWRIDQSNDETARERQRAALDRASHARGDRLAELRRVLMGELAPRFGESQAIQPLNPKINAAQKSAIETALSANDVFLLHGPPGTGKTTAVVELIQQAVQRGESVLATAPSNLAVDNMLERLIAGGARALRLGHPARVLPHLREHTLDLLVDDHRDVRRARRLVNEALALFRKADRRTRAKPRPGARRDLRQEARDLLNDARRLEAQAAEDLLNKADVLCVTTTGIDSQMLGQREFDLAVIDEACQSTEPGCWIPLLRANRVVLAGDHCQLPPTVVSNEAASEGFNISLFERLMALYGETISQRLGVQYRMHEQIMAFSSGEFYESSLIADESVRTHLLKDLEGVIDSPLTQTPVEFIDTAGAGHLEELEPDGESRLNAGEVDLVCRRVRSLLEAGVRPADIAVMAPYAAQVRLLRQELDRVNLRGEGELEVDTIDGFQGREKEAVIISLVRANAEGEVGFLADTRRMNVALTRARRKLIVLGDSATLSNHPFYRRMLECFERAGAYRTIWDDPSLYE